MTVYTLEQAIAITVRIGASQIVGKFNFIAAKCDNNHKGT